MPTTTTETKAGTFSADFLRFFKDIKKNNNREWFAKNKERYEIVVKEPCLDFIRTVGPTLQKISRHVVADPRPVGGSMFRIYRDTRFSKDKSPYKTAAGIHFSHRANSEEGHFPGFYLHVAPGDSGAWAGVWQPPPTGLQAIREAIAADPARWKKLTHGYETHGDSLKRVPRGFDPDHPAAEALKRKDFLIGRTFTDAEVVAGSFPNQFLETCRAMSPFNAFVSKAMGSPW